MNPYKALIEWKNERENELPPLEIIVDLSESDLYPHTIINGKSYYIPNPANAVIAGFFELEDEGTLFKVTGYHKNIQPMCLKFEEWNSGIIEEIDAPLARLVSSVPVPDFIDEVEFST